MPAPLSGYLGLGHYDRDADVFVEATDYTRVPFEAFADEITSRPQWVQIGGPVGSPITHAAVFAAETGGYPLAYWQLLPMVLTAPCNLAVPDMTVDFASLIQHAVNATRLTGEASKLDIAKGGVIGRCNGMAMITGSKLTVVGGKLVARAQHQRRASAPA